MRKPFMWARVTLAYITLLAGLVLATTAHAADEHQVVVCKYVGTPGVNETLQTGQNPIVVDSHALEGKGFDGTFPFAFEDAQGRSIAIRWAANSHDGDISECPGGDQPSASPSPSVTPSVSPTPTPTPSSSPSPSVTPSLSLSPTGTPQPTPEVSPTPVPTSSIPVTQPSPPSPGATLPATDAYGDANPPDQSTGHDPYYVIVAVVVSLVILFGSRTPASRRSDGSHDW